MEQIGKLISQQQTGSESPTSESLTPKHIAVIWMRMGKIFGHRWVSAYGECDDGTWLKGLANLSPEQVAHGLGVVMEIGDEWPPSLPSFRKMCKGEHEVEQKNEYGLNYVPAYYHKQNQPTDAKRLQTDRTGHMTASKQTVDDNLAKLRTMVGRH